MTKTKRDEVRENINADTMAIKQIFEDMKSSLREAEDISCRMRRYALDMDYECGKADSAAGGALRELDEARNELESHRCWLREAKVAAGYDDNTSFDDVWAEALAALLEKRVRTEKKDVNFVEEGPHGR